VLLAGAGGDRHAVRAAIGAGLEGLGARVLDCDVAAGGAPAGEEEAERSVSEALAAVARIEMLIVDGGGIFAAAGAGQPGLSTCLQAAWNVTRALVNAAFIAGGEGGRIAYLAPAPGAGAHASAARAGLENLARTLSIEWARHQVTTVAIAPGERSSAAELAALTAYLASPAGAYFSGCVLDLTGPAAASPGQLTGPDGAR
jgi:citronellol/citronellal dehydrogenase